MQDKTYEELIEIIGIQNSMILDLLNETKEQENMINVLMTEFKK